MTSFLNSLSTGRPVPKQVIKYSKLFIVSSNSGQMFHCFKYLWVIEGCSVMLIYELQRAAF